jgi:hypothetical protein
MVDVTWASIPGRLSISSRIVTELLALGEGWTSSMLNRQRMIRKRLTQKADQGAEAAPRPLASEGRSPKVSVTTDS